MKILKIALLSIISCSAFATTSKEKISSAETSVPTATPQICPQDDYLFLGITLINLVNHSWNLPPQQKHKLPMYTETFFSYIVPRFFADYVTQALQSNSQPSVTNGSYNLFKKGMMFLVHTYSLQSNVRMAYRLQIREKNGTVSFQRLCSKITCSLFVMYTAALAALQYRTIQALENPQDYKIPAALKTTLNILIAADTINIIASAATSYRGGKGLWYLMRNTLIILSTLHITANYIRKTVAAAENYIATQRQKQP